jgi:hypothetical protein
MLTITPFQTIPAIYAERISTPSIFKRFMNWCEGQQQNRLSWLAIGITGHGCILTPLTVMTIVLSGINMVTLMLAMVAMTMTLVVNLAALPTRITIPVFMLSILIDLGIIVFSVFMGFNLANAY